MKSQAQARMCLMMQHSQAARSSSGHLLYNGGPQVYPEDPKNLFRAMMICSAAETVKSTWVTTSRAICIYDTTSISGAGGFISRTWVMNVPSGRKICHLSYSMRSSFSPKACSTWAMGLAPRPLHAHHLHWLIPLCGSMLVSGVGCWCKCE